MKKDSNKTDVTFRKYLSGEIIALFPHEVCDFHGNVGSYMHIGQHSGADYSGVLMCTKPATKKEYADLKKELEKSCGYNLNIIQKQNRDKYLNSLNEVRGKSIDRTYTEAKEKFGKTLNKLSK